MRPELVLAANGEHEAHMVWALIKRLDSSLNVANELHWPIAWMTGDERPQSDFAKLRIRFRNHQINRHAHVQNDAKIVYEGLRAVCRFIDRVRAGLVAGPGGRPQGI